MGATEDQLRRDAQLQREQMGDTLEAIGDRLSPERIVERRKAAVGQRLRSVKEAVMGSPDYDEHGGNGGGLLGRAEGVASSAGGAVQTAYGTGTTSPPGDRGTSTRESDRGRDRRVRLGAPFATVLPKSKAEQRLVDDARPQLQSAAEELKEVGRAVASDVKERSASASRKSRRRVRAHRFGTGTGDAVGRTVERQQRGRTTWRRDGTDRVRPS